MAFIVLTSLCLLPCFSLVVCLLHLSLRSLCLLHGLFKLFLRVPVSEPPDIPHLCYSSGTCPFPWSANYFTCKAILRTLCACVKHNGCSVLYLIQKMTQQCLQWTASPTHNGKKSVSCLTMAITCGQFKDGRCLSASHSHKCMMGTFFLRQPLWEVRMFLAQLLQLTEKRLEMLCTVLPTVERSEIIQQ